MNKFIYLFLVLMFLSCGFQSKYTNKESSDIEFQIYANTYTINQDSILVKTIIILPISNLVFIKKNNKFEASIETILRIEDAKNKAQINRSSNISRIVKDYFEDTRSSDLYQIQYDFILGKNNNYQVLASVKDLDSFKVWDDSIDIDGDSEGFILFSYVEDRKSKEYIYDNQINRVDTLWVEIPRNDFDFKQYRYVVLKDGVLISDNNLNNCHQSTNNLLRECPILVTNKMEAEVEIQIHNKTDKLFTSFININKDLMLWSSDIDAVLGVMSYILPYSETKSLYKLPREEQVTFVLEYIKAKDIDPDTNNNEFLDIIIERYQYANSNFSTYNIGWRTDRGEVYIVNGPPSSIQSLYDNINMTNKEIWYYKNQTFIFSDESTLGELKLINQF